MAVNGDIAIEAQGLERSFGEVKAVDGIDVSIRRGEIFGIVGPDGAGKTTTLRLLVGLIEPDAGVISVFGRDVAKQAGEVRDSIGYMPQQFGQYLDLTVEENVRFYADLFGVAGEHLEERFERLLHMTRMEPFRKRRAGNLSGGMKQKLALMCTLLHRPQALFLDEPTNGVDPVSRRDFWAILYDLVKDGLTVLVTTSYLDEAERCNRVALLYKGRIIEQAPPDEIERSLEADCYAIRCPDLRQARAHLREQPEVVSVEAFGPELHAFVESETALDKLSRELEQKGLGPVESRPIRPSLEDSFIALVRRQEHREARPVS